MLGEGARVLCRGCSAACVSPVRGLLLVLDVWAACWRPKLPGQGPRCRCLACPSCGDVPGAGSVKPLAAALSRAAVPALLVGSSLCPLSPTGVG